MLAKDLERGTLGSEAPLKNPPISMTGNIKYAEQHDKGFPAGIEGLPGVSFVSSCVDEWSPSIRGGSRGPDALQRIAVQHGLL